MAQTDAKKRWRLVETKGEKVAFVCGEQPVAEYRYAASRPKTYVHPLYASNGFAVTLDSPADHVHHRGVFLAWSNVNGFDFWGETNPGAHGQIVHQRLEKRQESEPATLTAINHWVAQEKVLLVERRTLRVPAPESDEVWLEWESELVAQKEPVTLDASGHVYNGLGIRFPRSMDGGRVLNANDTSQIEKANGENAVWCAYFGRGGASLPAQWCGVAIFDHPQNPRHPTPFFVMNQPFGFLSAAPTFRELFRLKPDEPLRMRYALVVYLGEAERGKLDRLYRKWSGA